MTEQEFERVKELWQLIYAERAIQGAISAVDCIVSHQLPHDHPLYDSLVTAMVVQYGKPFSNNDIGKLQTDILPTQFDDALSVHQTLLDLRCKVYAHTDSHNIKTAKYGPVNQAQFEYDGESMKLFVTYFDIRPENFIKYRRYFAEVLQRVTAKKDLFIISLRHEGHAPASPGTYILNVYEPALPVFITHVEAEAQMMLKTKNPNKVVTIDIVDSPVG